MLFRNLFFAALCAAFVAGLALSAVHFTRVVPLIMAAETYEDDGAATHDHGNGTVHDHGTAAKGESAEASEFAHNGGVWVPADGFERNAYTLAANLLTAAAFALIMGAISVLSGLPVTFANGAIWGLAGFASVSLAPALGLPPELPGMAAADLGARQVWWWGTALATGAAALLVAKFKRPWAISLGLLLVALPHLIGAPRLAGEHPSAVPAALATEFAATALTSAAVFWLTLGLSFGAINDYIAKRKVRS